MVSERASRARWVVIAFTAACGGAVPQPQVPPAPCTVPVEVALQATGRLNPNERGVSLPTRVRVYRLKGADRIEEADFGEVWEKSEEVLAEDLLGVQELTLFPSAAERLELPLEPETKFLAGVAIFRHPSGSQWRAILPLPPSPRLCAEYGGGGAPAPAVVFRFDGYRVEARSRLFSDEEALDLPSDVAPRVTTDKTEEK